VNPVLGILRIYGLSLEGSQSAINELLKYFTNSYSSWSDVSGAHRPLRLIGLIHSATIREGVAAECTRGQLRSSYTIRLLYLQVVHGTP
jgi:hypothetical protein